MRAWLPITNTLVDVVVTVTAGPRTTICRPRLRWLCGRRYAALGVKRPRQFRLLGADPAPPLHCGRCVIDV